MQMNLNLAAFTHWRLSTAHPEDSGWIELFNLTDCERCGKMVRDCESTPWILLEDQDMRFVREHLTFVPAKDDPDMIGWNENFNGAVCSDCDSELYVEDDNA